MLFLLLLPLLTACGINTIPTLDEQVNADWAQVQNQYQRRADLIPNLVETVKGYAKQEQEVLTQVTEARAKVGADAAAAGHPDQSSRRSSSSSRTRPS